MKKTLQTIFILTGVVAFSFSTAKAHRADSGYTNAVSHTNPSNIFQDDFQRGGDDINDVVFYPNPVKSFMTVRFPRKGDFTVTIYNIIGDKVLTKSVMDDDEIHLDVSDLQNGLYFISYEFGGKVLTKRFSKIL